MKYAIPSALVCVLLTLPSLGSAQTCRVYCPDGSSVVQDCSSNNDPCTSPSDRINPTPDYNDGADRRRQEQIQFDGLKSRFNGLLDRLRGYGMVNEAALFQGAPPPANNDQLNQRVDRFYEFATYQHRYLTWKYEQNKVNLIEYPNDISLAQAKKSVLETELRVAETDRMIAENMRDSEIAKAEAEEKSAEQLWNKGDLTSRRLLAMQLDVRDIIYALIPVNDNPDKPGYLDNMTFDHKFLIKFGLNRKGSGLYSKSKEYQPPVQLVQQIQPAQLVAGSGMPWTYPKPTAPVGSIETKLNTLDTLAGSIISLGQAVSSQERGSVLPLRKKMVELRESNDTLQEQLEYNENLARRANVLAKDAIDRTAFAQVNQKQYATDALTFAATATVWNHVRTTIVMPPLERFLRANGLLKGMPLGDAIRRIGANPQELIPTTGRLKEWQRMVDVQRKILELPEYFAATASAVADVGGNSQNDTYAEVLAKDMNSGLNRREIEIMNKAAGSMPGPLGKIVRKWMINAPM